MCHKRWHGSLDLFYSFPHLPSIYFIFFLSFFYLDFFTFDFFFLAVVSTGSPAGVKWSKRISVGSVAVQNHDRASPRFTAKLLFRDWQPVNDSMLEQIWPLLSLYVRVPTGCLWSVWYTTSNRISRRTDFCHRENRHCTWFPDRNDVSVDFWIEKGWAVATATMKTGIDENDIANRHCQPTLLQTERRYIGFTWFVFRQYFHVSFGIFSTGRSGWRDAVLSL